MKDLIKTIRSKLAVNEEQFAAMMGVSPVTVSRWENNKVIPSAMAQKQMYDICVKSSLDLTDYLISRDHTETEAGDRKILYHASRTGIIGRIEPKSRSHCDFGKGFYMGTNPLQPLTLVCNEDKPVFYTIEFDMSGLNVLNIEAGIEWAMLIAYYRGYMKGQEASALYQRYAHLADGCDVITGFIADDRMYQVLTDFFEGRIMDTALIASLSALNLGNQIVAVSQKACDRIRIVKTRKLEKLDLMLLIDKSEVRRKEGKNLTEQMISLHRRDGRFFDEILKGVEI